MVMPIVIAGLVILMVRSLFQVVLSRRNTTVPTMMLAKFYDSLRSFPFGLRHELFSASKGKFLVCRCV